jgi:hypothetical protein
MASKQDEISHLDSTLTGLRKTYMYWHSKPSSLIRTEILDLFEDTIEVIENTIKRHRKPEGVN